MFFYEVRFIFSKNLVHLRKAKKISQYELADKLGFSRRTIANYELGTQEPDFKTLVLIADFFEVSTDKLLRYSSSKKESTINRKLQIKNFRKQQRVTQAEIANLLGIARTTYAMYEQGKREPDFATLANMADFFDITIDELLGRPIETDIEDATFKAFRNDPNLKIFYKELPESDKEKVQQLKDFWEFIKHKK